MFFQIISIQQNGEEIINEQQLVIHANEIEELFHEHTEFSNQKTLWVGDNYYTVNIQIKTDESAKLANLKAKID